MPASLDSDSICSIYIFGAASFRQHSRFPRKRAAKREAKAAEEAANAGDLATGLQNLQKMGITGAKRWISYGRHVELD